MPHHMKTDHPSMPIEIITIGDEILSGNVINTNTAWLSDVLWLNGFDVAYHTSVRDDSAKIREVLLHAAERAGLVLVTGGLGPTADDFTIEVAAKAFRKKLVLDSNYLGYLENLFRQWGRKLADNNKKQAYVPQGAKTFRNRVGTAPGIGLKYKNCRFYFFPGVPKELKWIFADFVLPEIIAQAGSVNSFESKLLKCFGSAESELDYALKDLYKDRLNIENVRIGFRAHFPETFIKLSAWHKDRKEAQKLLESAEAKIRERVGAYIYGEGLDTLEGVVGRGLSENKKTVATAESCTGGLVAHRITNIPGASRYFKNGVVAYCNEVKIATLGVLPDVIKKHGAVSSRCAVEMAQGARRISKTDYGVAVTGIAGPTGGSAQKPVGTVHIALANCNGVMEKKYVIPSDREMFKLMASSIALNWLRKELLAET